MKQILLRKGRVSVEEVPAPAKQPHLLLVEVSRSLISTGTEISSVQQSGGSLLEKARKKPEVIQKVLESIRVRGLSRTWEMVQSQLDQSQPLGYSCSGTVISVGTAVTKFRTGDRVACAGTGLANHAEVMSVPENLVVKIPHGVSDRGASFVAVGAIAMQGVRRAEIQLGESVCVLGLGLIGQLTVQLLAASGCRVFGLDLNPKRVETARRHGLEDGAATLAELQEKISLVTEGRGVDATLLTASTESSELTQAAFSLTRKKGRIVVVGAVGLQLERSPFYEKEQDFVISCSYGPGRYDPSYEKEGQDYPYAFVRWTQNRNMAAFLELVAKGRVDADALVDREIPLDQVEQAYDELQAETDSKPLAAVLRYESPQLNFVKTATLLKTAIPGTGPGKIRLGLVGAGEFSRNMHLPNLQKLKDRFELTGVVTSRGVSAQSLARQWKVPLAATDPKELIQESKIDAVLISTRHNTHAALAQEALRAGKHVYVEKPMALTREELTGLEKAMQGLSSSPVFMVGFNRRFSPLAAPLRGMLKDRIGPLMAVYRVNAGALPPDHWFKTTEGGGRLRGEACHMVDFYRFLAQSPLKSVQVEAIIASDQAPLRPDENFSALLSYEDGSLCTLLYTTVGNEDLPKEKLELHWDGKSAVLEDFVALRAMGTEGDISLGRQDKGHLRALEMFATAIQTGISFPIPWDELVETTQACIQMDAEIWGRMP